MHADTALGAKDMAGGQERLRSWSLGMDTLPGQRNRAASISEMKQMQIKKGNATEGMAGRGWDKVVCR